MARRRGTEDEFELATLERLELLGYTHLRGRNKRIKRRKSEVVLRDRLRAFLKNRYPELPDASLDEAVRVFTSPEGVDTLRRNKHFHLTATRGIDIPIKHPDGREIHRHIYPIDWDQPENNEFWAVNQFPLRGQNDRRPDIIIFINGLPLVVFELKNPFDPKATAASAHNQIQHYINEIPQLFDFNAVAVASDRATTLHGVWTAGLEWFAPWKSINGFDVEPPTTGAMKALIEGLFPKDRLLDYIRHFLVFEGNHENITKKGAKYHQFFAARRAATTALEAFTTDPDRQKLGVIWHTTGSGKSLTMTFLIGALRKQPDLENPTFVVQVDRTDLDDQLYRQLVAAETLVGTVRQAESIDQLRAMLRSDGGGIICTTIEKFQLKGRGDNRETEHPLLSERSNIIVMADEAHRSQYGFTDGYARYLYESLPNAKRLGFTGTPITLGTSDTLEVFGNYIHTYDMRQAQEDGATVPIFYAARQTKLHLAHPDLDRALEEAAVGYTSEELEQRKGRWAALSGVASAEKRMDEIAADLVAQYRDRGVEGKAMAVCMTRPHCVALYDALMKQPQCPETKIVMTGNLGKDPAEWSRDGHLTTKAQRDEIKERMKDLSDPLKIVIVCDMWLTGTDIPCLHTLFVDKPMKGHNIIQAISRVNRVFRDKPNGLVVDYIGIGDDLRKATVKYTEGGGTGDPAPDVEGPGLEIFQEWLKAVRGLLPAGIDYGGWRKLKRIELEDRYSEGVGHLLIEDERRDEYLSAESKLTSAHHLVKHLDEVRPLADEVVFFQRVRRELVKTLPEKVDLHPLERTVRDLVDDAIDSEGLVDIFENAGIPRADISILDDKFLESFQDRPHENLRLKLLEKLLRDEIQRRRKENVVRARSFTELLEATLQRYHDRLIDAATVIRTMIEMRQGWEEDARRAQLLGLSPEELAFYDAVAVAEDRIWDEKDLADLIHDVVASVKSNIALDWTEPHRSDIRARVRVAVKNVLRRRKIKGEAMEKILEQVMTQAQALWADWSEAV